MSERHRLVTLVYMGAIAGVATGVGAIAYYDNDEQDQKK